LHESIRPASDKNTAEIIEAQDGTDSQTPEPAHDKKKKTGQEERLGRVDTVNSVPGGQSVNDQWLIGR
jgi:hypothetical protein